MSGSLAGFWPLLRLALRRDRVRLPAWVAGIGLFSLYCSAAMRFAAPHEGDLQAMTALMSGPAGTVLIGPGYGFDVPTHAIVFAGAYGLYVMLLAAAMSILLAVRHTRGEEEGERLELVRAAPVSRHAPPAVATAMLLIANALTALVCWVVLAPQFGTGSLLFAAGVAAVGTVFGAVALVTAQLASHSRTASGYAFLVLGVAFAVRGIGDVLAPHGSPLSWISPLAWAQQTRAYVDDRWWPLMLGAAAVALSIGIAAALQARRDLGAGIWGDRAGRARGSGALASPLALAMRIQRGSIIGWSLAALLTGSAFGALADEVRASLGGLDNPLILAALGGEADRIVDGYLAVCLLFGVILATCFAIMTMQRLTAEEHSGRAELALALPIGRMRWMLASTGVALAGGALVLLLGGVGTGIAAALVTGDSAGILRLTAAALAFVPAVAAIVGCAALGYGAKPGWAGAAWAVAGYGLFMSLLAGPLQLPDWATRLSVFTAVGQPPLDEVSAGALVALLSIAVALTGLGLVLFRRRDLGA